MSECVFCKKYNMSEEDLKRAVNDGWISTTVPHYDEIYQTYKNNLSSSTGSEDAVIKTSITFGCSRTKVYEVIAKFK